MLDKTQTQILDARKQIMSTRRILCTGNPNKKGTIASGIKEIWPNSTFIHLSNGYDFLNLGDNDKELELMFRKHNTFINASYVGGVQIKLLQLCNKNMTIGDVFNIGSTHEYDNLGDEDYTKNKLDLRALSLELNSFRFQTCHIVMGGIDVDTPETVGWVKPVTIAKTIKWITEQQIKIPIIGIDQPKKPW